MQIQQLRYFLEIAKCGKISLAAQNLYISQPSLSQQMTKLEQELGIALFIRKSKSISLTDAGKEFALQAQRIVNEFDLLSDQMQRHGHLNEGTLEIGMLWIAGYIGLFDLVARFQESYPNIRCRFKMDGSTDLLKLLDSCSIYGAFVIAEEEHLNQNGMYLYYKILEDTYVAVVSKRHPLAKEDVIRFSDLSRHSFIMPSHSTTLYNQINSIFEKKGLSPNILCETSHTDLVLQLAEAGLGVGICSHSVAQNHSSEELVTIPLERPIPRSIFFVTLKELADYPSIRAFLDFTKETFPQVDGTDL